MVTLSVSLRNSTEPKTQGLLNALPSQLIAVPLWDCDFIYKVKNGHAFIYKTKGNVEWKKIV